MNGGKISDNKATGSNSSSGGGVYMSSSASFIMNGGTISGNEVTNQGAGVYVYGGTMFAKGTFTMSGGTISGNTATDYGGGVCHNGSAVTINGKVDISGNTCNNSANNVNLYTKDKTITIETDFDAKSKIGVNTRATVTCNGSPVTVTGETEKDISAAFTADNEEQYIIYDDVALQLLKYHSFNSSTITKEPTCTEDGIETGTCTSCRAESVSNPIPALGHNDTHTEAKVESCTENGNIEYWHCSTCGKYFSDEDFTTEIAEDDTVVPAAHKLEAVEETEANCTQAGNKPYWKCTVCGKLFSDEEGTNALTEDEVIISDPDAHDWGDWEMILEPSKTDKGTIERECNINSEHVETEEIPELTDESLWELVDSAEPSCTKDGYEIYESTYGRITVKLPATGHTPVTDERVEPTCDSTGLTEGSHCFVCGETIVEQTVIAMIDHSWTTARSQLLRPRIRRVSEPTPAPSVTRQKLNR